MRHLRPLFHRHRPLHHPVVRGQDAAAQAQPAAPAEARRQRPPISALIPARKPGRARSCSSARRSSSVPP